MNETHPTLKIKDSWDNVTLQEILPHKDSKWTIIHIVLGSFCAIVFLFCCYTFCCKKKKNLYTEFEDHPQRDEIAKNHNGIINESFKDDLYDFNPVDLEAKDWEYSKKKSPERFN